MFLLLFLLMGAQKINIEPFLDLANQYVVIDVRSPGEYNHAHIPGACSLPLFTDEERKIVGTAYKQESRQQAIKLGLDFFGPKMKKMVEDTESIVRSREPGVNSQSEQPRLQNNDSGLVLVYCWRGGMRSGAVSWLLDMYGFKVYTLVGGYKKFRNYVLDTFRKPAAFKILGGFTGSGKTEVLKELAKRGEPVIDLEEIARHKGSAFGSIGMPKQPTQEMFENLFATELRSKSIVNSELSMQSAVLSSLWLEDESQRIGHVNLPADTWKMMRQSPVYFLDIPFEERLEHLVQEYGRLDKQEMLDAIGRIKEKLGGLNAKAAAQLLEEGNTIESFRILLKYYDKFYQKGLHNRESLNSLLHTIECKSVTPENASQLVTQYQKQKT